MGIDYGVACPFKSCYFMEIMNIIGSDITRNSPRLLVMDHVSLLLLTPPGSLAVEHSNNSGEVVQVPYFHKTSQSYQKQQQLMLIYFFSFLISLERRKYLLLSLTGSLKKQSRVGLPGSFALRMEPSGRTSFLRRLKSCCPGLSLLTKFELLAHYFTIWYFVIESYDLRT